MTIELNPLNHIGGLTLYLSEADGKKDFVKVDVPREALSILAMAAIQEVGADISQELVYLCAWVVKNHPIKTPPWRTLDEETQETLAVITMEEIRDSANEYAHEVLDMMSIQELADTCLVWEMADDRDPTKFEIQAWIKEHVVSS